MTEDEERKEKNPADFFLYLRSYDLAFSDLRLEGCGFHISGFSKGDLVRKAIRRESMWKIEIEWDNDRTIVFKNLKKVIGLIDVDKKRLINSIWFIFVPTEFTYGEFYLDTDNIDYFIEQKIGFCVRTGML